MVLTSVSLCGMFFHSSVDIVKSPQPPFKTLQQSNIQNHDSNPSHQTQSKSERLASYSQNAYDEQQKAYEYGLEQQLKQQPSSIDTEGTSHDTQQILSNLHQQSAPPSQPKHTFVAQNNQAVLKSPSQMMDGGQRKISQNHNNNQYIQQESQAGESSHLSNLGQVAKQNQAPQQIKQDVGTLGHQISHSNGGQQVRPHSPPSSAGQASNRPQEQTDGQRQPSLINPQPYHQQNPQYSHQQQVSQQNPQQRQQQQQQQQLQSQQQQNQQSQQRHQQAVSGRRPDVEAPLISHDAASVNQGRRNDGKLFGHSSQLDKSEKLESTFGDRQSATQVSNSAVHTRYGSKVIDQKPPQHLEQPKQIAANQQFTYSQGHKGRSDQQPQKQDELIKSGQSGYGRGNQAGSYGYRKSDADNRLNHYQNPPQRSTSDRNYVGSVRNGYSINENSNPQSGVSSQKTKVNANSQSSSADSSSRLSNNVNQNGFGSHAGSGRDNNANSKWNEGGGGINSGQSKAEGSFNNRQQAQTTDNTGENRQRISHPQQENRPLNRARNYPQQRQDVVKQNSDTYQKTNRRIRPIPINQVKGHRGMDRQDPYYYYSLDGEDKGRGNDDTYMYEYSQDRGTCRSAFCSLGCCTLLSIFLFPDNDFYAYFFMMCYF